MAGRTQLTSASDFAFKKHGKPSQVSQRIQVLKKRLVSLSLIPSGR